MEKVRPWCGQPSDRGRLKNRTNAQKLTDSQLNPARRAAKQVKECMVEGLRDGDFRGGARREAGGKCPYTSPTAH